MKRKQKDIDILIRLIVKQQAINKKMATAKTPIKLIGAESLLSATDVFIFDCDGVIW